MKPPVDIVDRTFEFGVRVVQFCETLASKPGACRTLANQLLRSGTSIGANVEEGQAAYCRKEFVCKNMIALKESRETRYWLRLLHRAGVVNDDRIPALIQESTELTRILGAIVVKAREKL